MNGLPKDLDVGEFVGRTLEHISVGQYQLTLVFSGHCIINIEGQIAVDGGDGVDLPSSMLLVYPLINKEVSVASAIEVGTLTLAFANGMELQIFDSNAHFESYNFTFGKELFVV